MSVPRIEVLTTLVWPWPESTLHWAYLTSGLLIAAHYLPLLKRAWRHPEATSAAQSLLTWAVWTLCRVVAFTYGLFILHDLVFLLVVGADLVGRVAMAVLIVRARWLVSRRQADAVDADDGTRLPESDALPRPAMASDAVPVAAARTWRRLPHVALSFGRPQACGRSAPAQRTTTPG